MSKYAPFHSFLEGCEGVGWPWRCFRCGRAWHQGRFGTDRTRDHAKAEDPMPAFREVFQAVGPHGEWTAALAADALVIAELGEVALKRRPYGRRL